MGCVYRLISPSGKSYIGVTTRTVAARFAQHVKAHKKFTYPIYLAMRKYGPFSFDSEVLFESDDPDELLRMEVECVNKFNAISPSGYNLFAGGPPGLVRAESSIKKQSNSARRRWEKPEERLAQSERIKGAWKNPELQSRMSRILKKSCNTPEFKEAARKRIKTQRLDSSFLKAQAAATSSRMNVAWSDPEYRVSQLKCFHSPEARAKAAKSIRRHWSLNKKLGTRIGATNSNSHNAKISKANTEFYRNNPEARDRISKRMKIFWRERRIQKA